MPEGTEGATESGTESDESTSSSETTATAKTFTQQELGYKLAEQKRKLLAEAPDLTDLRRKATEYDKMQEAAKSEMEKAVEKARQEATESAKAETNKTWESRVVRAEIRVAAAGRIDPDVAVALIDPSAFSVNDEGNVDDKAITEAITALLKSKPQLAVNGQRQRTDFDAGSRTPPPGRASMNDIIRQAAGRS